ncbi:MAG: Nif3-like dinuclear metal center hexameric protein [Schleiferiaceae bacterium]
MKIKNSELFSFLESWAPRSLQESYDNSGLIVGSPTEEIDKCLVSLDCTEDVVQDAIDKGCKTIVSHHPIVFKGLKSITGKNYVERTVLKAIKNDISLYAIHTNLDNVHTGVNAEIMKRLGVENTRILAPKSDLLAKLVVFVPTANTAEVLEAMWSAGAGRISDYSECSFSTEGWGTFKAGENSNPHVGDIGKRHSEAENRVEVVVSTSDLSSVVRAMNSAHPYEEVAYDVFPMKNPHPQIGAGMIGELPNAMETTQFLKKVKDSFQAGVVRHTAIHKNKVKTIAVCGGSVSFLINAAKGSGADVYITGDVKYHEFFDAENQMIIADIGHFESEQYTIELLIREIREKFPNFAPLKTDVNTNPLSYL